MGGRSRGILVGLSGAVLLLALFASARPDLVARWTRPQAATNSPRPALTNGPAPIAYPQPANHAPDGDGCEPVPAFPTVEDSNRNVVRFAIDFEPGCGIEGRVTDPAGRPEPGRTVCVSALQGEGSRATTDAAGRYRKEGLIPGVYMVALDPPVGQESPGGEVSVLAEVRRGETAVVDFLAHQMGRLSGRVLREGRPAAAAEVMLLQEPDPRRKQERAAAVATDDQGEFVFERLEPGSYRLVATHEHAFREAAGVVMRGMARLESPVEVRPGENRVDLAFTEARLRGKVVDARTGAPLSLAMVTVLPAARRDERSGFYERYLSLQSGTQLTDEAGGFELSGLAPGNYRVVVNLAGYRKHTEQVTVTGGVTTVAVPLRSGGGTVEVELTIPPGVFLPLLNLRVMDAQGYDLAFLPMGGNDRDHNLYERTQQRLANLEPGRHTLALEVPGQGRFTAEVDVSEGGAPRVSFVLARGN